MGAAIFLHDPPFLASLSGPETSLNTSHTHQNSAPGFFLSKGGARVPLTPG